MSNKYLPAINLLLLAGLAVYIVWGKAEEKKGYVLNQQIFDGFKGTQELTSKVAQLQGEHKVWLDSVSRLIEKNATPELVKAYQENASNFQIQEQELSAKYTSDIWKQINFYIADFGKENHYDFIFGASGDGSLMYARDTHNITSDVVNYINKRYNSGE